MKLRFFHLQRSQALTNPHIAPTAVFIDELATWNPMRYVSVLAVIGTPNKLVCAPRGMSNQKYTNSGNTNEYLTREGVQNDQKYLH